MAHRISMKLTTDLQDFPQGRNNVLVGERSALGLNLIVKFCERLVQTGNAVVDRGNIGSELNVS